MKWVKRGLWVGAWGAWAWLGFGLHRELPRDLGPVVCKLPFGDDRWPVGFIDGGDVLVTKSGTGVISIPAIGHAMDCWNARTGKRLGGVKSIRIDRWGHDPPARAVRHGFVFGEGTGPKDAASRTEVWNLSTGEGKPLPYPFTSMLDLHQTRPLAAITSDSNLDRKARIGFLDLEANRIIGEWATDGGRSTANETIAAGYFLDDADEFLVVLRRSNGQSHRLVRCSFNGSPHPGSITLQGEYSAFSRPRGGRMSARNGFANSIDTTVFDVHSGERLWSATKRADGADFVWWSNLGAVPIISRNGRCILHDDGLIDVETCQPVWRPRELAERASLENEDGNSFWVMENWKTLLSRFDFEEAFTTWALRDLNDGRLLVRLHNGPLELNQSRTLSATTSGTIYPWPASVNYPFFVLCQSILALPLILLWAMLRWRRKRRMRMTSIAA